MFTLVIRTENAAFEGGTRNLEIARILRETAKKIDAGAAIDILIRDANGNRVGTTSYTAEED